MASELPNVLDESNETHTHPLDEDQVEVGVASIYVDAPLLHGFRFRAFRAFELLLSCLTPHLFRNLTRIEFQWNTQPLGDIYLGLS